MSEIASLSVTITEKEILWKIQRESTAQAPLWQRKIPPQTDCGHFYQQLGKVSRVWIIR
jgi:hypothetical protein